MHYVKKFDINGIETRQVACIELHGKPNAATEGAVGVLGVDLDSSSHQMYVCIAVNGAIHTWIPVTNGGSGGTGVDGITPHIGTNGNWYLGDEDTGVCATGTHVVSVEEVNRNTTLSTYRMNFSDGKGYEFTVYHGQDGEKGEKGDPGEDGAYVIGLTEMGGDATKTTYRMEFSDGEGYDFDVFHGAKGEKGDTGATGQRGTGLLPVTTAPASYTTEVGGITPKYRMAISTIKTQAGVTEVLLGDTVRYSYYHYPIAYLDASYAYFATRVSIRGASGADGTDGTNGVDGKDGADGKSAYAYAKDGGYAGTEAEFSALLANATDKRKLSLGIASDGLIYVFVDGAPVGTGIPQGQNGDVFGYVDETNTVVLTGNLADGTYTVKYEMDNGDVVDIGNMVLDTNVYYSVTESLTNCVNSNTAKTVASGDSYTATITANSGYTLSSVTVTMGGSAVSVTGGAINIASVTGNIVITAVAKETVVEITNWIKEVGYTTGERLSASAGTTTTNGAEGCETTGYIPAKPGDILRIKNITTGSDTKNIFLYFNGSKEKIESAYTSDIFVVDEGNGVYASNALRNVVGTQYIRFTSENIGDTSIVTVNEKIV